LFENELDQGDINLIRNAALYSMPTGNSLFKEQIEKAMSSGLGIRNEVGLLRVLLSDVNDNHLLPPPLTVLLFFTSPFFLDYNIQIS